MQITVYIPVPHCDPFGLGIEHDTVLCPFVNGAEVETEGDAFAVFHFSDLRIVPELIAAFHKLFHLQVKALFFSQTVFPVESFAFLIYIFDHFAQQHGIV